MTANLWLDDDPMPSCGPCMDGNHAGCGDLLTHPRYGLHACGCGNAAHGERVMIDHRARAENIAWFAATGESATGAARRLGLTYEALEKYCRAHGLADDWRRLCARQPYGVERVPSRRLV